MTDATARDQLAKLVLNRDEWDAADAILAAGWRPPATVISEPGEGESAGTPTSKVLRYEICIDDTAQRVLAGEVVLVHPHRQGLGNRLEVWIRVAKGELRTQTLRVFGTGQEIPAGWRPLGSCVAGPFVWHVCGGE